MKMDRRPETERTELIIALVIAAALALISCSQKPANTNQNPASASEAPVNTEVSVATSSFDLTGAWKPEKVTVKTSPDGLETGPRLDYNLTTKPGQQLIALELTLKPQRIAEPVFSADAVLIDSTGERHKALFAYPSALTEYKPGGGAVVFLDDWDQGSKKVSELGGKVIAIFSIPSDRSGLHVEIDQAAPVAVELR